MGRRWVDGEGDQMMDEDCDNTSESESDNGDDDPEEIKAMKV